MNIFRKDIVDDSNSYIYGRREIKIRKKRSRTKSIVIWIVRIVLGSITLAFLYYVILSLFVSTDTERKLKQENLMYEKIYPQMVEKEKIVSDAVRQLQIRDDKIYTEIFHTQSPTVERLSSMNAIFSSDTIPDKDIVLYSSKKLSTLESISSSIEDNFMEIYSILEKKNVRNIPMRLPLHGVSYAQVGATIGTRLSPIFKVDAVHEGIDLISPAGTPVYAAAVGTVTSVVRSRKGKGNMVTITHEGGYVTKYAHLSDISVGVGRRVGPSSLVGNVGSTGNSFAPHLHFEVWKDDKLVDPINHFFGSVTPYEYTNMLLMSISTRQSLD